jgi:hypothetical protein
MRAMTIKDEGGRMKDEKTVALVVFFHPSSLILHPFHLPK